jgi:hypothetical protein
MAEQILSYVATGHYSADIIDYLLRDSLFTGAGYGAVDWSRLIALSYPQGNRVALDSRAEDAFDSFLLARLFMFTTVYYHRTVRAFYQIARRYLRELKDQGFFKQYLDTIEGYSSLDEGLLYSEMARTRSKLGLMLLDRKNPYSKFEEARLGISDPLVARFLDGPFMKGLVLDAMRGKWTDPPEEAFFVDTPKIALNPITRPMQDKTVLFKKSDGTVEERDVWNTRWGKLSEQMGVVRLYIHDDFSQYRELLKGAFHGTIGSAGTFV